ncbi:MAG: pitrilysin family protein [Spirulinaceae cyanobacterium]
MQTLTSQVNQTDFPASIFKLDNGLTVIHQQIAATPVVVADVWVKAGAIREPLEWSGMAHFLEHMVFKGTKRIAPGMFDQIIESRGGITNAATGHDYAHFYLTTASTYLGDTLPHLGEILLQAEIHEVEFMREREVVIEEMYSCYDDPDWLGFQALCSTLYQQHPYGRSILGEEEQLKGYTPNQMRCFHASHYQPENITVSLVGGVCQEEALSLATEAFGNFKTRSESPPCLVEAEPPLTENRRRELHLPRLEQARLLMAWIGPGIGETVGSLIDIKAQSPLKDAYSLDLLAAILASGRSSRLVRELREEKRLIQDISCDFSLQQDSSLFTISAWLDAENLEEVETIIRNRLQELQTTPVKPEELNRSKRLLCNDYAFSTETPSQLAGLYGYYNTVATAELSVVYPFGIQRTTELDLQRIANQYLSPERYAVTVVVGC